MYDLFSQLLSGLGGLQSSGVAPPMPAELTGQTYGMPPDVGTTVVNGRVYSGSPKFWELQGVDLNDYHMQEYLKTGAGEPPMGMGPRFLGFEGPEHGYGMEPAAGEVWDVGGGIQVVGGAAGAPASLLGGLLGGGGGATGGGQVGGGQDQNQQLIQALSGQQQEEEPKIIQGSGLPSTPAQNPQISEPLSGNGPSELSTMDLLESLLRG